MPLLTVKNLALAYGDRPLLDHIELSVDAGERIALIGRNGEGKSCLMKILAGLITADDGEVMFQTGVQAAYCAQEAHFADTDTVLSVLAGDEDVSNLDAAGWKARNERMKFASELALPEDMLANDLSGGQKKRLQIAATLAKKPDLALFDEPTNHLDLAGIEWLESTIQSHRGAVIVVSHDRSFLERCVNRIIELDRGRLTSFPGSFAAYNERKAQMLSDESVVNAKFDKFLAQEEAWIRQGVEGRRTRSAGRVKRLEDLRSTRESRRERKGNVNITVDAGEKSGKLIAELQDASYAVEGRVIIPPITASILRGDKVGIIGRNGAGKTTLVRMLLDQLQPTSGSIYRPRATENVITVAYFDQFRESLDDEKTLSDVIAPGSDYVEINGIKKHIISYLGDFLFPPNRARAKVKALSGGERARLLLARLFARPANLLVLDEPTNDLDIETIELLEELLQSYTGTVFLVSHDRSLLDSVATTSLVFDADGVVREYPGGYSDWLAQRPALASTKAREAASTPAAVVDTKAAPKPAPRANADKKRLSFKETRELEQLPAKIEQLDSEKGALESALADASLYIKNPLEAKNKGARLKELEVELAAVYARWEALEAIAATL